MPGRDTSTIAEKSPRKLSRPTIYSVAKAVGVSVSTVSHIINHPGKYRYSRETQQRVREACDNLQYSPNALARSLANQTNPAIGLVCDSLTDVNITRAVDRIVELATMQGRHVVVTTHPERLPWTTLLDQGTVDWIIVLNQNLVEYADHLLLPRSLQRIIGIGPLPIYTPRPFGHQIVWDTTRSAILAIDHLAELGHREIAILAGLYTRPQDSVPRIKAAYEHAATLGIKAHWISHAQEKREDIGGSGRLMTQDVLKNHPGVTAIYCRQDYHVVGVYHELHKAGKQVPGDMAVIGNFNLQDILQFYPPLTSVDAPLVKGAEVAMDFVQMEGQGAKGEGADLTDHITLIKPQSTMGDRAASVPSQNENGS